MKLTTMKVEATNTEPARIKVVDERGRVTFSEYNRHDGLFASCKRAAKVVFGDMYRSMVIITHLTDGSFEFVV